MRNTVLVIRFGYIEDHTQCYETQEVEFTTFSIIDVMLSHRQTQNHTTYVDSVVIVREES